MPANATVSLTVQLRDLVSGPARGIKKSLGGIKQSFTGLGTGFDMAGKVGFAASAVNQLGAQARGVLTSILDPALKFEDTMARVGALTTDLTDKQFKELTTTARNMGRETRFTAQEAAEGLGQLAIAGFRAKEQMKALPPILKLTQASGVDMGRTADIASDLMGAFGKEAKDVGEISGVLAATFSNSTTTLETLFETLKYGAPIATAAGVSMQQTAVLTGLMGNAGIKGSQAGTTLRGVILSLAAPTAKAQKALRGLGFTAGDISENLDKPAVIIKRMADAFAAKDFTPAEKLKALKDVFGKLQATGVAVLLEGINKIGDDGKTSFERLTGAVDEGEAALDRIATTMDSTRLASVRKFQSAMESLKLDLAQELAPALGPLVKDLTELTNEFAGWARENPALIRTIGKTLIGVVAFTAVFGPLLLTLSSLISAFTVLRGAAMVLGAPFRLVAGGVAGIGNSAATATGKTKLLAKGLHGIAAAGAVLGAAVIGWEIGKTLDSWIGKVARLRGEMLSTELAISAGESDWLSGRVEEMGKVLGIESLAEAGRLNRARNRAEREAIDIGRAGIGRGRGESRVQTYYETSQVPEPVSGKISIEVTDERINVGKVERKSGPDLEVGVSARTP